MAGHSESDLSRRNPAAGRRSSESVTGGRQDLLVSLGRFRLRAEDQLVSEVRVKSMGRGVSWQRAKNG